VSVGVKEAGASSNQKKDRGQGPLGKRGGIGKDLKRCPPQKKNLKEIMGGDSRAGGEKKGGRTCEKYGPLAKTKLEKLFCEGGWNTGPGTGRG